MLTDRDHHWLEDVWQTVRRPVRVGVAVFWLLLVGGLVWLAWVQP